MGHGALLVLEAGAPPASRGQRVQVIAIDLVSRDVFQRINVFIGFLSSCCKKLDAIPGHRSFLKECYISSSSPCLVLQPHSEVQVVCETRCCSLLSAATQPFIQCRLWTSTGKLVSDLIPRFLCSQAYPWLPSEHLEHLPGCGFRNTTQPDTYRVKKGHQS